MIAARAVAHLGDTDATRPGQRRRGERRGRSPDADRPRSLGTSRDKLLELFGGNGLARLERLEAEDMEHRATSAKIIEGSVVPDMAPDQSPSSPQQDDF